jgi:glycosyltransferase involved in cell wall biosynthesis
MKIAIQAADLDAERIDGTRVYIKKLLEQFGKIDQDSHFLIYHKKNFNPELTPPDFSNYKIIKIKWPLFWTQIRLSFSLLKEKPDALWMPMHNIPYFKPKNIKTVVTIHDLAFKYFPECFTKWELAKLNFLAKMAITKSDKIITISESSKKDILKFYPKIKEEKIKVIYHGFDEELFKKKNDGDNENLRSIHTKYKIPDTKYLLYVGAVQPRKNLEVLIEAFERIKNNEKYKDLKLVLAGEKAWLWKDVFKRINDSPNKSDIITPGKIKFEDLGHLMRGAEIFCFPSLYEGFGLPILEAFSAQVPVICANNSSLPEVAGDAALYFEGHDSQELAQNIKSILEDDALKNNLIQKGVIQAQKFSWEKCARITLEFIKS